MGRNFMDQELTEVLLLLVIHGLPSVQVLVMVLSASCFIQKERKIKI